MDIIFWLQVLKSCINYIVDFVNYCCFARKYVNINRNEEDIQRKVVVLTGGSLGIGKASAMEFAQRGATVVIGDVDLKNGAVTVETIQKQTGNKNVKILKLDLSEMASVEKFAKTVSAEFPKIKILVNNAGIGGSPSENIKTKDGFNIHVAVNYMGHYLLTNLLLKNLKAENKSRVVTLSSDAQLYSKFDLEDLNMDKSGFGWDNWLPYTNSKLCNALFSKELGKRLAGTNITTYAMCPAMVDTPLYVNVPWRSKMIFNFFMSTFSFTANEAASEFVMYCALDKSLGNETGKMYQFRKPFRAANERLDDELAHKLWKKSSEILNLKQRLADFENNGTMIIT